MSGRSPARRRGIPDAFCACGPRQSADAGNPRPCAKTYEACDVPKYFITRVWHTVGHGFLELPSFFDPCFPKVKCLSSLGTIFADLSHSQMRNFFSMCILAYEACRLLHCLMASTSRLGRVPRDQSSRTPVVGLCRIKVNYGMSTLAPSEKDSSKHVHTFYLNTVSFHT